MGGRLSVDSDSWENVLGRRGGVSSVLHISLEDGGRRHRLSPGLPSAGAPAEAATFTVTAGGSAVS